MAVWIHTAMVTGTSHFPIDMLRYDSCHPSDQEAVGVVSDFMIDDDVDGKLKLRSCHVTQVTNEREPEWTPERWASFGWQLQHLRTHKFGG